MIEKLTQEQIDQQPTYRELGIKIGTQHGVANRERVAEIMPDIYKLLDAPPATRGIIYFQSPHAAINWMFEALGGTVTKQELFNAANYGSIDSYWLVFYLYFREVCGLKEQTEAMMPLLEMAKVAGWFWTLDEYFVVCDRHINTKLNVDSRGRTHCSTGPAIEFGDGVKIYELHRIPVPAEYIEQPETLTVDKIDAETNVERRRVLMEHYGFSRYLMDSGAKLINKDEYGELYQKAIQDDEPLTMVKVTNSTAEPDGTFKDYFLLVHPELRPRIGPNEYGEPQKLTAKNAVASTFRMRGEDYNPEQQT